MKGEDTYMIVLKWIAIIIACLDVLVYIAESSDKKVSSKLGGAIGLLIGSVARISVIYAACCYWL